MAETIVTFQSQLSGVMETVFKAAMYEITRLVEDSFLEEVTRCREQVESLKRRLKWSEGRRKEREGDRRGRCLDCGRAGEENPRVTEKSLKQESVLQEETNSPEGPDGETPCREEEEARPEAHSAMKAPQSPDVQGEKMDRPFKEEVLRITPETNESQERWGVNLEESSGVPGPSKRFNDQKTPKCHVSWEAGYDQRPESGQHWRSSDPSEPLFQSRYGMEDLGGFDKTAYGDSNMIDMGNLDGLEGSPPHLGEDLSYIGHYEGDVEAPEGAELQVYQAGATRNRGDAVGSPAGSPSRTNIDVSGELSCLLINEEGYLQDQSILYPEHVPGDPGGRLNFRGQGIRSDPSSEDMYGPSGAYNDTLNLGEKLQPQAGGRGGRRHTCNLCSMSFPDSNLLKTHKQTHKISGQVPPFSCTQCGKTFTQACNLKVHQRIHSGQGLQLCSHCGKGFSSFSDLKTHKCGQTGDKPYCCTVCGNQFSRLWNLKLHRRIHTQEKPHRCTMCDKSFTRADILKVHQRTHTGERPYCCTVCGRSFKRLDHLKSHQRKHMTDLLFPRTHLKLESFSITFNLVVLRHGTLTVYIMSDLDTLIVTFQTQLSDVMETLVKTAMYEVTRLVEDGFLEEVQRRNQEVEALRMQLQWAERKLGDQGGKPGRCVDCAKDVVKLSSDTAEEDFKEQQDDVLEGCGVKEEGDSVEGWTINHTQEVIPESTQAAGTPASTLSPERRSQTTEEEDDVLPAVTVKEEEVNKPSCSSVHWSGSLDGDAGPESHSSTEMTQPNQIQDNSEELLRDVMKQDPQISAAYVFSDEQEEAHMATDPSLEMDSGWADLTVTTAGLLQIHRLATEIDCDSAKTTCPLKQTEQELSNSVTADVDDLVTPAGDHISSSASPKATLRNSDTLGVTIKQEVIDSDGCDSEPKEKKTKSGMASFSCSVKKHRLSSEALRQNHISHKATLQEVMKLHSKVGTGLRLQAALQHFHRPMKKTAHAHTAAALSVAHSHAVNPLSRTPSTSKAAPPPPLSVPRVHLGDKHAVAHNRTGVPWVGIKTHQSANSHHANPLPHPDSHAGPRHLLRCGQCGKCFPHPSNLRAHLQTHTGERPFCCSLCGRSFTKLSNLKAHRRVHTGERPYCCLACGKRFTQKCNLKRHQRIHLDV
ncbi:uncharacterized protein LOC115007837 [Cottoperca gobio]|uniref:Uncharacterized protein LOC115007837 n=1 Tax=Cottoperca gobio TaxID=56716 RepID=A0A6J2PN11_COTGO|nr:uncharacterized protein LOC115007837 [Cottoperca gobio]